MRGAGAGHGEHRPRGSGLATEQAFRSPERRAPVGKRKSSGSEGPHARFWPLQRRFASRIAPTFARAPEPAQLGDA